MWTIEWASLQRLLTARFWYESRNALDESLRSTKQCSDIGSGNARREPNDASMRKRIIFSTTCTSHLINPLFLDHGAALYHGENLRARIRSIVWLIEGKYYNLRHPSEMSFTAKWTRCCTKSMRQPLKISSQKLQKVRWFLTNIFDFSKSFIIFTARIYKKYFRF